MVCLSYKISESVKQTPPKGSQSRTSTLNGAMVNGIILMVAKVIVHLSMMRIEV